MTIHIAKNPVVTKDKITEIQNDSSINQLSDMLTKFSDLEYL